MTIDTTKLRELAQKATPGMWGIAPLPGQEHYVQAETGELLFRGYGEKSQGKANADFVCAANPATVLALLDEIDRLRTIEAAARNLVKVKGRHHSEIAMNRLMEALK